MIKMFLLGALVSYLVAGIVVLVCNTVNADEDVKDLIFGWWLLPVVLMDRKIRTKKNKKWIF